ncbi:MAG: tetratricopeptide repeat protein [Oscillospiraceae bacterium]|nr:tetratricopeptide repeat protein [Oscillospiraceae bacterium]
MIQEDYTDAVVNAETAFSGGDYAQALQWFRKALELNPDDPQTLTKAGTACIPLAKYEESVKYFGRAAELDPENGDTAFNLGNAYYFCGDYSKALQMYAQAEIKGISEEAKPKLYYQMAMLCSVRQDVNAALLNFRKYEEADPTGTAGMNPEVISEKIRLYSMIGDLDQAANCAVQWIAVAPDSPESYLVYFNILAEQHDYERAEEVLRQAEQYALKTPDAVFSIRLEEAALLAARADDAPDEAEGYLQKAYDLLNALRKETPAGRQDELTLTLAEVCTKMQRYAEAAAMTEALLPNETVTEFTPVHSETPYTEPDEAEIDAMAEADMQTIDEKLAAGEIDESLADSAEVYYDENGNEVRSYPDGMFDALETEEPSAEAPASESAPAAPAPAPKRDAAFYDRVYYILVTCYAALENYAKERRYGAALGQSEQAYLACFGHYHEAFAMKKLAAASAEVSAETAEQQYSRAIAFCRNVMMKEPGSRFAAVFRARMYAETGKFAKAEEMAGLLMLEERDAVMAYIRACRDGQTVA